MNIAKFANRARQHHRWITLLAGLFAVYGVLGYLLWSEHRLALKAAETIGRNLAETIEARLDASQRRTDAVLQALLRELPDAAMRPNHADRYRARLDAELDARSVHFPELAGLRVFDAEGRLLYTNGRAQFKDTAHVDDRDFFIRLKQDPTLSRTYSKVFTARSTGTTSFAVVYPIRSQGGEFLGAALALINLDYFKHMLERLDIGPNGIIAIRRSDDFSLILRQPPLDAEINKTLMVGNPAREAVLAGKKEASVRFSSQSDAVWRTFSIRALDYHPFYVLVALADDDVLREWRGRTHLIGIASLLLIGLMAMILWRLFRSERQVAAILPSLAASEQRFRSLFHEAPVGHTLNRLKDGRFVEINIAFAEITGYGRQELEQLTFWDITPSHYAGAESAQLDALRAHGQYGPYEKKYIRKDGSLVDVRLNGVLYESEDGEKLILSVVEDISDRKAAEEQIHHLAHHDTLTGLPNRFHLQGRLEQALATARRDNGHVAVIFLDMDRFKIINDTLGHHVGDLLLIEVGHRLRASVRASDVVARLGGDEFVVVLADVDIGAAHQVADKILRNLGLTYRIGEQDLRSTPSLGIALFPEDGDSVDALMKNADTAMYHAKTAGRNNVQFFAAHMNAHAGERLALENSLRLAVENDEFELHYQPQIEVASGRVVGVEALVRWRHPEQGLISPLKFIPVAEETGLIVPLGEWVLWEAVRQLAAWRAIGLDKLRMAVNLSAHQLRSPTLATMVGDILAEAGIDPIHLELEITESVAMDDPQATIELLGRLRQMGIDLAIDDFGTGYSSLSYLKLLPIQWLKLDRSFVMDIEHDPNDATICSATIALAHSLGLGVIAEGVETEAQRDYLARLGCDVLQGYLYSRPLPAAEAETYLLGMAAVV